MTVRPEVILARLARLAGAITQLERLRALPTGERRHEPFHELALERALHMAAEAIFDIGHHVLAGRGLPVPSHYRDVLPALAAAGVLPDALVARLDGLAGLRNILVHDYVAVDPERLWDLVDERLADLHGVREALAALPELGEAQG